MSKIFRPSVILWLTLVFSLSIFAIDKKDTPSPTPCWKEEHPENVPWCISQIEKQEILEKNKKELTSEERRVALNLLKVDKKRLEKIQKESEKVLKTQRTWATSRSKSFLTTCSETWVSEDNAGPGSQWNPSVTLTVINNTGMDIKTISLSDRGPIVQNLCVGGSLVIHRNWNGNTNGQNFSFMATAEVVEGGTPRKYLWNRAAYIYPNQTPQSGDWVLTKENKQYTGYH